jgi:ATP synthase protein I
MGQEPTPRQMGYYAALAQTSVEMVLPIVVGLLLDHWLGTAPWITCIGAVVGFAGGLTHLILIVKQKERDESSDTKPPP